MNEQHDYADTAALSALLKSCAEAVSPLLPRISAVIRDREDDFLHLGAQVFQVNSGATRFSDAAGKLAGSVSTGTLKEAIGTLSQQAAEARDIFSQATTSDNLDGMTRALDLIQELDRAMLQFNRLVKTLNVLGITTRIESARLGSAGMGFTTLADDVESLAAKIVQHVEKIREHSRLLVSQVEAAHRQTSSRLQGHAQRVESMFQHLFADITELENLRTKSVHLVGELANGSRQVAENMGQVIASVQFHDITRQQVEHVEEILVQAVQEISAHPQHADPTGLAAWVRDVLRLQAPQLCQAQEMFQSAVEDLIGNLENIALRIQGLGNQINALAYDGQDSGNSILNSIRTDITNVVEAMLHTGNEATAVGGIMSQVATTVAEVSSFVADIEEVGSEIELIALNASVKAAHTGEQGRALGVLAVAIQHLSVDARSHTERVAEKLHDISNTASYLNDLAVSANIGDMVRALNNDFTSLLAHLGGLDAEMKHGVQSLSAQGQTLVCQISGLTSSIHFHDMVSAQLGDLEQEIVVLQQGFAPFEAELTAASQPDKLKEQLARYTMDSERLVHLTVLGHGEALPAADSDEVELFGDDNVELFDDGVELFDAPAPAEPADAGSPEDDFGDNVELF